MSKLLSGVKAWSVNPRKESDLVSRSQYSLVSCGELSPAALDLWLGLPEEVKYDPALAPFRRFYESHHDSENIETNAREINKRLPSVNSAPLLHNNLLIANEGLLQNNDKTNNNNNYGGIEIPDTEYRIPHDRDKKSKMAQAGMWIKISALLACWVFFTIIFILYGVKDTTTRQSFILPGDTKDYQLGIKHDNLRLTVDLLGPFQMDQRGNASEEDGILKVWLVKSMPGGVEMKTKGWTIKLDDQESMDFSVGVTVTQLLQFDTNSTPETNSSRLATDEKATPVTNYDYALRMTSTSNSSLPLSLTYSEKSLDENTGAILAVMLLCGLYVLIIFEVIHRTMAAVMMSTLALGVLSVVGERPSLPELVSWLDVETLLLLFSMMVLVALMAETGMFDFLAVFTFEVTKGRIWPLITVLCVITTFLSTFLDNVTTVLLMTPVNIRLCEVMELDPIPVLISMVLFSNIGGTATPVGDPPNVIIVSNKIIMNSGVHFTNFTMHMTLGITFICIQTYYQLRFIYRDTKKLRINVPKDIQEIRRQITIWRNAAASLPYLSKDQQVVRSSLEKKIRKLTEQLDSKVAERNKVACDKETYESTLRELKEKYKIRDKVLLIKALVAIAFVVVIFFMHSFPELKRISLAWSALMGCILLLILADREELEPILHRVEWSTLLFFAALFVLMEALTKLGFIVIIGGWTEYIIMSVDESYRLAVAILLIIWVSGTISAFVDNVPLTTMMVRVVAALGSNPNVNLPMTPLVWALSLSVCLGGNGTLIGASANLVCAGVAEQHGYRISFLQFFRVGFPVMIGHLLVATLYLLLCHCLFTWH